MKNLNITITVGGERGGGKTTFVNTFTQLFESMVFSVNYQVLDSDGRPIGVMGRNRLYNRDSCPAGIVNFVETSLDDAPFTE